MLYFHKYHYEDKLIRNSQKGEKKACETNINIFLHK